MMENLKPERIIDLAEYGGSGTIVIRPPNARKSNEFKNAMSKYMTYKQGKVQMKDDVPIGDMEIAMVLSYVYSAPFPATKEALFDYCDRLDERCYGMGDRLYEDIQKALLEVDGDSPFADSPSAETANSE